MKDRTQIGDLVVWNTTQEHAYFDTSLQRFGILLRKIEHHGYWLYAEVLNEQGRLDKVMLYKEDNPV